MNKFLKRILIFAVFSAVLAVCSIIFALNTKSVTERHLELINTRSLHKKHIVRIVKQPDGTTLVEIVSPTSEDVKVPNGTVTQGGGNNGGGNGNQPPQPDPDPPEGDVVIDGWLVLHESPSGNGSIDKSGLNVSIYNSAKWSMGEGTSLVMNRLMVGLYGDTTAKRPVINGTPALSGSVNSSGRYWVGIGPAWFNPNKLDSNGYPKGDDFKFASNFFPDGKGHNFDIAVKYGGKQYYIYACMGDAKVHTYGDGKGYVQSSYDRNGIPSIGNRDFSCVEFVGVSGTTGAALASKLEFQGIVKY